MSTLEDRVGDLLRERADRVADRGPDPAVVRRRAVGLRRRRAATPLLAAATVGAVVLTGLALRSGPAPRGPEPVRPTVKTGPLARLPIGAATELLYAERRVLHQTEVRIPGDVAVGLGSFLPFRGGWLVAEDGAPPTKGEQGDNPPRFVQFDAAGRRTRTFDSFKPDVGNHVVALIGGGRLRVATTTGAAPERDYGPAAPQDWPAGFLSADRVVLNTAEGGERVVVRSPGGGSRQLRALTTAVATSADGNVVLGQLRSDATSGRDLPLALVDADRGTMRTRLSRACAAQSYRFSPDGRYLAGVRYLVGEAAANLVVCDTTTGRPVVRLGSATGRVFPMADPVWESSTAVVFQAGDTRTRQTALVRLRVGGGLVRVTSVGPAPKYPDYLVPFETQP